jgi:hypothetical protein
MADYDRHQLTPSDAELLLDESPDALIALTLDGRVLAVAELLTRRPADGE